MKINIPAEFRNESHHYGQKSRQRYRRARQWLVLIGLLLVVANGAVLRYAFDRISPNPVVGGLVCGGTLASTATLIAIWRRQVWARYILMCLLWGSLLVFSMPLMRDLGPGGALNRAPQFLIVGLCFYALANTILIRSRSIRLLVAPASSRSSRRI